MMYDIAALQAMYARTFAKEKTDTTPAEKSVYTWSNSTGQQYINGEEAPDTGTTETHKIFQTVWTQGADTTYDLSNFNGDQYDDLRAGQWLRFSVDQLADLNSDAPAGTPEYQAHGNVYNTLLFEGETKSLIGTPGGRRRQRHHHRQRTRQRAARQRRQRLHRRRYRQGVLYGGAGDDTLMAASAPTSCGAARASTTASYAGRRRNRLRRPVGRLRHGELHAGRHLRQHREHLTAGLGRATLIGDGGANR